MGLLDKIKSMGPVARGAADVGLIATGIGAPAGIADLASKGGVISSIKNRPVKPVKTSKDMLASDLNTLQTDPSKLGLNEAERQQMLSEATQADNAARQAQVTQLGQQALAGNGVQAGAIQAAQKQVADAGGQAAAQASSDINKLNQQMITAESNRIRGELDAARERSRQNTQTWMQFGMDAASALAAVVGL